MNWCKMVAMSARLQFNKLVQNGGHAGKATIQKTGAKWWPCRQGYNSMN
jgi:hypothetical protein